MAVGRISGPLLAQNLFRDDIPIAFYNTNSVTEKPVLYLNVTDGRIGIQNDAPIYTLDVSGYVNAENLRVVETSTGTGISTLGRLVIYSGTITTVVGPINIEPSGNDDINLKSNVTVFGDLHATGNITADGDIQLGNNDNDVVIFEANIGSNLIPSIANTFNIGSSTATWAEAYFEKIYTNVIASSTGTININPAGGLTQFSGNIKATGTNPIGTAPVVTNILYVTVDGNDTNDGRAQDSSRACRTISGAVRSPYYGPGTSIRVAPGNYLEENPILLQPYTSVIGTDLRTSVIEPINKTQDLFHLQSGCYLAQMLFLNGRSGLLPIESRIGFNRGAYCTAFAPSVNGEKIDVYHSPYIQNCTNQSGPWLQDGTLFVPNQTVQVPTAVGVGTWPINTNTLTITVTDGDIIKVNDSINEGQQHTGFFDARTLALANKPFLQEQVVKYVDTIFNANSFTYDEDKCIRDTGLIIDSIAIDMLQDSDSESVFAGLQYWNQTGYVDGIGGQITTTTNAIMTVQYFSLAAIVPVSNSVAGVANTLFEKILTILDSGTATVSDQIISNGLASTDPDYIDSYNALLAAKASIVTITIDDIITNNPGFIFNTSTCARDIGYIIDSVAFDVLHGGNKQSIKSGVYYYGYSDTSTNIASEIPQTTAAYNFIKSIILPIIKNEQISTVNTYQDIVLQVTGLPPATDTEVSTLQSKVDIITSIIRNGPTTLLPSGFPPERAPINLVTNTATNISNAYALLVANREFIQAEVIAYINSTQIGFTYSREKCSRDVGILIENIAYDVTFGGNQKAVESGLAYYDGVISLISGQEIQTITAIDYLSELTKQVIANTTVTNVYTGTAVQVINTALSDGDVAITGYENSFNIITSIINSGPSVAPVIVTSPGPDTQLLSAEVLLQANRAFIQDDIISYIDGKYNTLVYDQDKCLRDTGLIVDSLALDLLFSTSSQSTFAGIQYWNQSSSVIPGEVTATIATFSFVSGIVSEIVQNKIDTIRYSASVQNTSLPAATAAESQKLENSMSIIIDILQNGIAGVTDRIIPNRLTKDLIIDVRQAYTIIQANRVYIQDEAIAYINATQNPGSIPNYSEAKCRRDVGYILDSISFDLLYGGNKQSVQSGISYYGYSGTTAIPNETTATTAAYNFVKLLTNSIITATPITVLYQDQYTQIVNMPSGTAAERNSVGASIDIITNIISAGPTGIELSSISLTASTTTNVINAATILLANKKFIQAETVAYINEQFAFQYNQAKCRRDVGLIIDAVTNDIILGGNSKSIDAGLSYFIGNQSVIKGQITQTVDAINRIKDISLDVIANNPTVPTIGNASTQVILPFYQGGGSAAAPLQRNFEIITSIMQYGPSIAPVQFTGTSLFAKTGVAADDTKISHKVASIVSVVGNEYTITLKRGDNGFPAYTIGAGFNSTLYFGKTNVFPIQNNRVPARWQQRQVDPTGAMGGSLVDGSVVSEISPINSFVYDAFTQIAQGGRGIHITNNAYAQLVSVFTVFCSVAVQVDNGGIASITNSNSNFGDICLLSKGFGTRDFSGTIYNPSFQADPFDPELNQYYPEGYYPSDASVKVFIPDAVYRPHIGLIMEVEPPAGYINDQGFDGFITASANVATLTTGSLTITNIDTDGIAIGSTVYVRDFNISETNSTGTRYVATGTTVVDVGYQTIFLNQALTAGGGDPAIANSFDVYFCGNSYYTVLSSTTSTTTMSNASTYGQRLLPDEQVEPELAVLAFVGDTVQDIITNTVITPISTATQVIDFSQNIGISGQSEAFVIDKFIVVADVIENGENSSYVTNGILTSGTVPLGAAAAITLIRANYEFLAAEAIEYITQNYPSLVYDQEKCARDIKLIARQITYDIETGGNYNSVYSGLSYWARPGTYHVVSLEDQVREPTLFPDGSLVNFYQRSYMSALGYTLEYVGAGITYGSLPQVGIADPIQSKESVQLNNGKVFFTSTDQNGDFRIGPELVISQATGTLRGRTFSKSLFAEMTPFILAIESGGA